MKLQDLTLRMVRLPLIQPYVLSYRTFTEFEPIIVEVRDADGRIGWGEGHISPGSSSETREGGWEFCREHAAAAVGGAGEVGGAPRGAQQPYMIGFCFSYKGRTTCLITLRWKERTRRRPRQILLPRFQTPALVSMASLSLLWESTGSTIRHRLSMLSPRRDIWKVPVSWGSVGAFQVSVYLARGGGGGTGVFGKGGPGGRGFAGIGGDAMPTGQPGSGMVVVGGTSDRTRGPDTAPDNRKPNAPGVVATSGSSEQTVTVDECANVGVFGQGGDQVDETKGDNTHADWTVGPPFAGAGVIGRGGIQMTNMGVANGTLQRARETQGLQTLKPGSAGIVGISGGTKMPTPGEYLGAGVFGISDSGRGGIFHSTSEAQLNLVPVLKSTNEVTPGKSRIGDLLVTINPRDEAEGNVPTAQLWFCDKVDDQSVPRWRRVAFV